MDISVPTPILEKILRINELSILTEYDKYLNYWPLLLIGLILSFLLTPIVGNIAKKYNLTYVPGKGKNDREFDNPEKAVHDIETPSLGGVSIIVVVLLGILLLFKPDATTIPILLALTVLAIGATLDDILVLSSKVQLGYQILAASIIAISTIDFSSVSFFTDDFLNLSMYTWSFNIFSFPLSFVFPGDLILIAWILLCINSVKWVAGSPGLVESYSLVIFFLLFIIGIRTFSLFSSSISILTAGAMISLLYFAYPPNQKIMSGSSGKSIYGFLIAILALVGGLKFSTTIMLLAIPIVDSIYVIIYRIIKYKPKNPIELMKINDTSHLHHKLLKLNLSRKQVILIETAVSLLIGSFAILTVGAMRYFVLIFGIAFAISFVVFVNYKATKKDEEKPKSPESKYSY